jgi:hypothetical protein
MSLRFTIDGSDSLERQLGDLCQQIADGVQSIIPANKLHGLVLAGGYGRGQGGVLKSDVGDCPYNDLEFYLFLFGNRLWNDNKYRGPLQQFGDALSTKAGFHIEFKIDSTDRLRRSPISMFTYDLVAAHRTVAGAEELFGGCEHHLNAHTIPSSEATRLLFNRCSGLLLSRELLCQDVLDSEDLDFIGRNIAKAELALGDIVLTVFGRYHWSSIERHRRLTQLLNQRQALEPQLPASFALFHAHHAAGLEFKLHPQRTYRSRQELENDYREISTLALQAWLWLESHRLKHSFSSVGEYALSAAQKCPTPSRWRNYLLNLRTFGPRAALDSMAMRYPRERLFNTLPVLLWNGLASKEPAIIRHLQKQLHTQSSEWTGWVDAYKRIWPSYG